MILLNRKVLISTFCSIGCSIHLFTVINDFLQFPVRTDIIYDYSGKMVVPEIDIILYNMDLFNMTELYLKYPEKIANACEYVMKLSNLKSNSSADCVRLLRSYYEKSYYVGSLLTVGDVAQLNVESLFMSNNSGADFIRNNLCSIKKYFSAMNTFIRVSCRQDSKQIEKRLVRNIVTDNSFCIKHDIYHLFGVRFAHPNSLIDPYALNYIAVEREAGENLFTFLRYRETTIESSEWPYQTNCRHYQKSKIFNQCLRKKISHLYPEVVRMEDVIHVGQFPNNFKFEDLKNRVNETLSLMQSECTELVKQPQCIEKIYKTQGRSAREKGSGIGLICLDNLIDFNVILKTYPKSTFTELLIYISSILGIWFGISIYGKLLDGFVFPSSSKVEPTIEIPTTTEE